MEAFCSSYTAPEVKGRPLEANADVYSFGVVMLVLLSGKPSITPRAGGDTEYLVDEVSETRQTQLTAIVMYINLGN